MASAPIAYNLLRLTLASIHSTPRGVDRVDFGLCSGLIEAWPAEFVGVLPTILGMRYFSRDQLLRGRDRIISIWGENTLSRDDPALDSLSNRFSDPEAPYPPFRRRGFFPDLQGIFRLGKLLFADEITFGRPMHALPQGSIYLDAGHFGLTFPGAFHWRRRRPDIKPVFLIHDAIPLEFPHLVASDTVNAHRKLMRITAQHASMILTPTQAAGDVIQGFLADHEHRSVPIVPIKLAIDSTFARDVQPDPRLAGRQYFVICGAIEPRKNHAVLLEVWRRLIADKGEDAPFLVIAGSPGYRSESVVEAVSSSPALRRRVIFSSGLSSTALAQVIAGSRALLMPSLAEGFGLPPAEALAVGTPALLSQIPAHSEAVGDFGRFLPANDADAWHREISALMDPTVSAAARARVAGFAPSRWPDYIRTVMDALENQLRPTTV
jgi:glycosyltransferase involved in cell wall biosynthesis